MKRNIIKILLGLMFLGLIPSVSSCFGGNDPVIKGDGICHATQSGYNCD